MQSRAGARERVFFPFGRQVCSAERVHVSGLAGIPFGRHVCSAERVRVSVLTICQACVQC